jgi:hypothetical protein
MIELAALGAGSRAEPLNLRFILILILIHGAILSPDETQLSYSSITWQPLQLEGPGLGSFSVNTWPDFSNFVFSALISL